MGVPVWTRRPRWVPAAYFPEAPILPNAHGSVKIDRRIQNFLVEISRCPSLRSHSGWWVSLRSPVALTSVGMNLGGYEGLGSTSKWVASVWVKKCGLLNSTQMPCSRVASPTTIFPSNYKEAFFWAKPHCGKQIFFPTCPPWGRDSLDSSFPVRRPCLCYCHKKACAWLTINLRRKDPLGYHRGP